MDKNENFFIGIDPSIVATGLILIDQNSDIIEQKLISSNKDDIIEKRFLDIMNNLEFISNIMRLNRVYVEGPSFMSKGNQVLQMGALNFFIRIFLYKNSINYKVIAPKTLKVFHTGRGDTPKKLVLERVESTLGVKFNDHNLADAYGLARMALEDHKNERVSRGY